MATLQFVNTGRLLVPDVVGELLHRRVTSGSQNVDIGMRVDAACRCEGKQGRNLGADLAEYWRKHHDE